MSSSLGHIAFIPDGNRRFAKINKIPSLEGHRKGYQRFKEILQWCHDINVHEVSFWGFSTENWKRSKDEVKYLMDLLVHMLTKDIDEFIHRGIRLRVMGRREDLSPRIIKAIERAEETTNTKEYHATLNLLFNYGGREELLTGVRNIIKSGINADDITEEMFASFLWTHDMTNPDLIIRTSGEQRLSGFLPWQSGYSELYFSPKLLPEFNKDDFTEAIEWYHSRERRFGV